MSRAVCANGRGFWFRGNRGQTECFQVFRRMEIGERPVCPRFYRPAIFVDEHPAPKISGLLQLRVLGFGLLQDGDVGVGVLPEGKTVLISRPALGHIAGKGVSAGDTKMSKRHGGV